MGLAFWIIILIISLAALVKASDYFILAAEEIGVSLGMPSFIVGLIIVSIGTSLPELVSSIVAVAQGSSEIVIGNVLGSNIANIFLVIGIAGIIGGRKFVVRKYSLAGIDLPVLVLSSVLLLIFIRDTVFSAGEAVFFLACLAAYIVVSFRKREVDLEGARDKAGVKAWVMMFVSPLVIYLGAKYTICSVIELSELLSIKTEVLALSAIALGTSLPELSVSVAAVRRGNPEMAIGNITGSNIFNTFAVMGLPALLGPLAIPESVLKFSVWVCLLATGMYVAALLDKKITRLEGGLLVLFYLLFIAKLYGWL